MSHAILPPPTWGPGVPSTSKTIHFAPDPPEQVYPTEARVRQKEQDKLRKAQGKEPRKRKKIVEDHHDDCGDCLTGIGSPDHLLWAHDHPDTSESEDGQGEWPDIYDDLDVW